MYKGEIVALTDWFHSQKIGGAGGIRTRRLAANTQVIHSTYRENRNNRTNRMSEVHGGDTELWVPRYASIRGL